LYVSTIVEIYSLAKNIKNYMITILDIVFFQSGQFVNSSSSWIMEFIQTIIGAGIGSGVTIWALYTNIKYDRIKEEEKRQNFQKEKVKYFQSIVKAINGDLNIQLINLKNFIEKTNTNSIELPMLDSIPMNDLERVVHRLNIEDYYHSYLYVFGDNQEIIDEFRKINSLLNYFDSILNQIKDGLKQSIEFDYRRKIKLQNLIENTMNDASSLLLNVEIRTNRNDFWSFLDNTITTFYTKRDETTNNSDLKFFYENFIQVMQFGLINFTTTIPHAHNLIIQMKNASNIYNDILFQNKNVATDFENMLTNMNEFYSELRTKTERLTNNFC